MSAMLAKLSSSMLPPLWLLVAVVLELGLHLGAPVANVVRFPWTLLGIPLIALGIILNLAADQSMKKHRTTVKPFQTSSALITEGVFGISRHPMYFGFVQILTGLAILLGSLTPFIIVFAFAALMERAYVVVEEEMLAERFGEAWMAYVGHVRKWI